MPRKQHAGPLHGVPVDELRPSEVVLHHWPAPEGRALLTNLRCLLLGRPHLLHRQLEWSQDLEAVQGLNVRPMTGPPRVRMAFRGTIGPGASTMGDIDPTYCVVVNNVIVFVGTPDEAAGIQQRIDDARAARCVELYGRVLPFGGRSAGPAP